MLKIQVYKFGRWWDKAYTTPFRARQDMLLYYRVQEKGANRPHRVINSDNHILYEVP